MCEQSHVNVNICFICFSTGWNISNVKELWEGIQKDFKSKYMRACKRKEELSWSTPYNNMKNSQSSSGDGGGSGGGEEET